MLDTVTVDENRMHNTESVDRVRLASGNTRFQDGPNPSHENPGAKYRTNEDGIDKNVANESEAFQVQRTVRHIRTCKKTAICYWIVQIWTWL